MTAEANIAGKITEIKDEMKRVHLWKQFTPVWVNEYSGKEIPSVQDFSEWLQFVYLPNMMQPENHSYKTGSKQIVPQAVKFFKEDVKKGKLLQLLIELDSL